MAPQAQIVVRRFLGSGASLEVPENAEVVKEDIFRVFFDPKASPLVPPVVDRLKKAKDLYQKAGLAVTGNLDVVFRSGRMGGQAIARYHPNHAAIELTARVVKAEGLSVLIHEMAHWQHLKHRDTPEIQKKYKWAMALENNQESTSVKAEALRLKQKRIGQRNRDLRDKLKSVRVEKGARFEAEGKTWFVIRPTIRATSVVNVENVKERRTFDTALVTTILENQGVIPTKREIEEQIEDGWVLYNALSDEIAEMGDTGFVVNDDAKTPTQNGWVPTSYSRTNYKEWFAELVTAFLLHPDTLDPEVGGWLKKIW